MQRRGAGRRLAGTSLHLDSVDDPQSCMGRHEGMNPPLTTALCKEKILVPKTLKRRFAIEICASKRGGKGWSPPPPRLGWGWAHRAAVMVT